MNREDIIKVLADHKMVFAEQYGVIKIGLFGSYVRGEARDDSDIDIAVELESDRISDHYFSLLHFLEDTFRKKIDLGIISNIKPGIKKYVDREIMYV
ncbi:MAG: nucleotidyltransferase family protein [Nitrospirota bacterium]|nr:nucleotidyltransferase family protein [Nitrospirota bacterium]